MSTPGPNGLPLRLAFPRVPAYAWSWLQRSRPVLVEIAQRLTGKPPQPGFVDMLADQFETDPFTRDLVIAVIADVAFSGRLPRYRPPGASWDRGLTWWAAAIAGTTPEEFERRTKPAVQQAPLFDTDDDVEERAGGPRRRRGPSAERAMLVRGLRELLQSVEGDVVPAAGLRQLLSTLEGEDP